MEKDTVVRLSRPGAIMTDSPLLEVLQLGARRMLQQVIKDEVVSSLGVHAGLADAHGRRRMACIVVRLDYAWSEEHALWLERDRQGRRHICFWTDGTCLEGRLADKA